MTRGGLEWLTDDLSKFICETSSKPLQPHFRSQLPASSDVLVSPDAFFMTGTMIEPPPAQKHLGDVPAVRNTLARPSDRQNGIEAEPNVDDTSSCLRCYFDMLCHGCAQQDKLMNGAAGVGCPRCDFASITVTEHRLDTVWCNIFSPLHEVARRQRTLSVAVCSTPAELRAATE